MATGADQRHPQEGRAEGLDPVKVILGLEFLRNGPAFSGGWIHADEAGCDQMSKGGFWKQVPRQLPGDELIKRQVFIQGANHPVIHVGVELLRVGREAGQNQCCPAGECGPFGFGCRLNLPVLQFLPDKEINWIALAFRLCLHGRNEGPVRGVGATLPGPAGENIAFFGGEFLLRLLWRHRVLGIMNPDEDFTIFRLVRVDGLVTIKVPGGTLE